MLWVLLSKKAMRSTMSRNLSVIKDDSRTLLHVGTSTSHRLFDILPDTWASAVICVLKAPSFAAELLHVGLVSNLSYLDDNETKLWVNSPLDGHAINSDVVDVIGNMFSFKRSHLPDYDKKLVARHLENQNTIMGASYCPV